MTKFATASRATPPSTLSGSTVSMSSAPARRGRHRAGGDRRAQLRPVEYGGAIAKVDSLGAPGGHGRYVGRVGVLAVALGVGAAIACSPGVAFADSTGSAGSTGSASSSSSSASGGSTSSGSSSESGGSTSSGSSSESGGSASSGSSSASGGSTSSGGSSSSSVSASVGPIPQCRAQRACSAVRARRAHRPGWMDPRRDRLAAPVRVLLCPLAPRAPRRARVTRRRVGRVCPTSARRPTVRRAHPASAADSTSGAGGSMSGAPGVADTRRSLSSDSAAGVTSGAPAGLGEGGASVLGASTAPGSGVASSWRRAGVPPVGSPAEVASVSVLSVPAVSSNTGAVRAFSEPAPPAPAPAPHLLPSVLAGLSSTLGLDSRWSSNGPGPHRVAVDVGGVGVGAPRLRSVRPGGEGELGDRRRRSRHELDGGLGPAPLLAPRLAPAAAPANPVGGLIGIFIGDGTADHPNAGLLIGDGFSYDASTCTGGAA